MFEEASSELKAEDHCCRNALLPEYVARSGVGIIPPKDAMVKIRPRLR